MMKKKAAAAAEAAEPHPNCLCMGMGPKLTTMLECRSEAAAGHFRNARMEMLKAMRAMLDERIEHLSRTHKKGTAVPVE
jgi:dihydropteroate synthase